MPPLLMRCCLPSANIEPYAGRCCRAVLRRRAYARETAAGTPRDVRWRVFIFRCRLLPLRCCYADVFAAMLLVAYYYDADAPRRRYAVVVAAYAFDAFDVAITLFAPHCCPSPPSHCFADADFHCCHAPRRRRCRLRRYAATLRLILMLRRHLR